MNEYEFLAEHMLALLDEHKHMPPEPVSGTIRGEMAVLRLLEQEGRALFAGEIARELSMKTSRIAAVLNSLEKKGMITRQHDPQDKRRSLVMLTQKGDEYRLMRRNEAKEHLCVLLSGLSEQEAETFVDLVGHLLSNTHNALSAMEV